MRSDFLQTIYDSMSEGLYAFDNDGKVLHVNKAMESILGFSRDDLIGKVGHDIFHYHSEDEHVPFEECPIYKSLKEGITCPSQAIFRTKDGRALDVEISCSPLKDQEKTYGYVVLFKDISRIKNLRREMEALSSVVKQSSDIIVIKDLQMRVIATNDAFVNASGHTSVDELIGKTDAQIFSVSPEQEPIRSYMEYEKKAQSLRSGEFIQIEEPVLSPDGTKKIFLTRKFPIYDSEGKLFATANISTNITKQKEYEKDLQKRVNEEIHKRSENESLYNKVFETANLGICLTDTRGCFVAVNPAYCKIYGYEERELIGKHFTKVVPEANKQSMQKLHDDFLIHRKAELSQEWDVQRKDGTLIRILASAGILDSVVGGPYKITSVYDITESYNIRKEKQEQEAMLIQQSKVAAMGEMLGSIAHQWRQPLNVLNVTTLDMKFSMMGENIDKDYLTKRISEIENVSKDMSATIDDFMNFYKPSKQKETFTLLRVCEKAYGIVAPQLKSNGIDITIDIDSEFTLHGVKGELQQVILNMLTNAKDAFLDSSKEYKSIKIYVQEEDENVVLCIKDNAGGIKEEIIERIFEPYFTTKEGNKGTGIGLYMSSMIVSNTFKGKIEAQNYYDDKVRVGVVFRIVISKENKK